MVRATAHLVLQQRMSPVSTAARRRGTAPHLASGTDCCGARVAAQASGAETPRLRSTTICARPSAASGSLTCRALLPRPPKAEEQELLTADPVGIAAHHGLEQLPVAQARLA